MTKTKNTVLNQIKELDYKTTFSLLQTLLFQKPLGNSSVQMKEEDSNSHHACTERATGVSSLPELSIVGNFQEILVRSLFRYQIYLKLAHGLHYQNIFSRFIYQSRRVHQLPVPHLAGLQKWLCLEKRAGALLWWQLYR